MVEVPTRRQLSNRVKVAVVIRIAVEPQVANGRSVINIVGVTQSKQGPAQICDCRSATATIDRIGLRARIGYRPWDFARRARSASAESNSARATLTQCGAGV